MKIVFFTHERAFGGASRALVTLINEIKKDNNIVVVAPFKDTKIFEYLDKDIETISTLYGWWSIPQNISILKKILFRLLYKFNFISIYRLKRILKKMDVDLIHTNTSVIDIGAKVANKLQVKHVWHFRELQDYRFKFIRGDQKSYKYINGNTNKVIYVSGAVKDFYKKKINCNISEVVYDGVPKSYIIKKNYPTKKVIKFLLIGSIEKNKGQELVIEASLKIINKGITDFEVCFAGNDMTGYYSFLKDKIEKYNLHKHIKYVGFQKDVSSLRKKYDVELMCSSSEAFGLVTVEAMMAGNLVIGSNCGGTSEIIRNNINGILFEKENSDDLAKKMIYIMNNKYLIEKYGKQGQIDSLNNFSSEIYAKNIMAEYKKILKVNQ